MRRMEQSSFSRVADALERIAEVMERQDRRREMALAAQTGTQTSIGDAWSLLTASGHLREKPESVTYQTPGRGMRQRRKSKHR